jgi:DNA-binding CsgD family transcriptional regulator
MKVGSIVGREAELVGIDEFLDEVSRGAARLILEGEAGIGKTILWRAGVTRAEERGYVVLASRPGPSEPRLTFVGLADLLQLVESDVLDELPSPQRRALDVALLRADPQGPAPDQRSVAAGFLSVLRELATRAPVVVAIDDVQWLDRPSWRVLEFALRRLESEPVGFLCALRADDSGSLRELQGARRLRLGPLNIAALHEIIKGELGHAFARPTLVRIERTSSGNPFFAVELARAILEGGVPVSGSAPLPVPADLTELLERRVRRLPARSREALLTASALSQPTLELLDAEGIEGAEAAGLVRVDRTGRVGFVHPLLAAAVYGSASHARRREVHRDLAGRLTDAEERARHLALAANEPEDEVARNLVAAARSAGGRGAPDAAIELLELACELTPAERVDDLHARRFELVRCLAGGGDPKRAAAVAGSLARESEGVPRARALLALAFLSETAEGAGRSTELCEQALLDVGDDVELRIEIHSAASRFYDHDLERKQLHAHAALELVDDEKPPDPRRHAYALLALAEAEFFAGRGIARDLIEQAAKLESSAAARRDPGPLHMIHHYGGVQASQRLLGMLQLYSDELEPARAEFERERRAVAEHGDETQLARTLGRLAATELKLGNWDSAGLHLAEMASVVERTELGILRCWRLLLDSARAALLGEVDAARSAGEQSLALAIESGADLHVLETHTVLGFLELSLENLREAHAHLGRADEIWASIGSQDPGLLLLPPHADHVESLIGLGELGRAEALADRLERQGRATGRPWARATGARCLALLRSARGDLDGAREALELALAEHERLPMPFELGRTLLVAGQVHRRRNERRLAADALARSTDVFERLGASLWAAKAHAERRRLGLRRGARDELTPSEQTVASLAASGLTNREIAERIFVSPKTVEANLSRVYRKLGIHSRAELGARMTERERLGKT